MTELRDQRTAVYRFFDAEGRLLYVGIAVDILTRWSWHQRHADWWPKQDRAIVQWYPDRATAEQHERIAIREEGPVANIAGRGKTPLQSFRIARQGWQEFAEAAKAAGTDRSKVLQNFIRWYIGDPEGKSPTGPDRHLPDQVEESR